MDKLKLDTLPDGFSLIEAHAKTATVKYEGNARLNGVDGAFKQIMDATGAAQATTNLGRTPIGDVHIELALHRT